MLVEGGSDLLTLKWQGGWRSSRVAEGYIKEQQNRKCPKNYLAVLKIVHTLHHSI